ncbi:MAG: hypothetical protein B7X02_01205 [Rhodospirillales bacterium 12-54-5]|nr:MAG: hypothetical protein B7X02_01205 [Rhodospirillales bacterium 12-54-5]
MKQLGGWVNSETGRASKNNPSAFSQWVTDVTQLEEGGVQFEMLLPQHVRSSAVFGVNDPLTAERYLANYFGEGKFSCEPANDRSVIVTLPADMVPFFDALMVAEHSHETREIRG